MKDLIALAKGDEKKSLGTLKPTEILDFEIKPASREWKEKWTNKALQRSFLEFVASDHPGSHRLVKKVPYDYFYLFLSEGDSAPHRLKIEDWEIGALYWNCLGQTAGDEEAANLLVRQKYFDTFTQKHDIYLFFGTTQQFHNVGSNPFIIIGIFYPPKTQQPYLF